MELNDRVVVITGGGSGIGEALAVAAKAEGARHVVVADLDGAQAARVAALVGGTGVALDVRDEAAVQRLVDDTESAHGPIDLFVSNAGFVTSAGLEDSNDAIQRMWEVHCMAHIYAARAVLPSMIARGEGYLLNTASAAGLLTQIGSMSYSITKAAAVSLAEWLAVTHHHQGIRVSVLCPQAVRTNIIVNSPDYHGDDPAADAIASSTVAWPRATACSKPPTWRPCASRPSATSGSWCSPIPRSPPTCERKATDRDRWLAGMRRFQSALHPDGNLPGQRHRSEALTRRQATAWAKRRTRRCA